MLGLFIVPNERKKHVMQRVRGKYSQCISWVRGTIRPPTKWRVRPLEVLVGVINMVLEVPLVVVPTVLPTKELNILLEVLLIHLVKPHMEASKLIVRN